MWRRTWLVFSQAVTVAVAMLFVVLTLKPEWLPGAKSGGLLPTPTLVQLTPTAAGTFAEEEAEARVVAVRVAPRHLGGGDADHRRRRAAGRQRVARDAAGRRAGGGGRQLHLSLIHI